MRYIPHTAEEVEQMLETIGVDSVDALFDCIPGPLRLGRALDLPEGASEPEVVREFEALAARNRDASGGGWFLGAGAYNHFTPSVVDAIASRSEFYTAYTPYQAEMSQGTLQTIFEWQTMMSSLTGLDVANASMYDGASAAAEAALMAMRMTRRSRVVCSEGLHPHYRDVVDTYLGGLDSVPASAPLSEGGRTDPASLSLDGDTACLVVQQPNFFGCVEDLTPLAEAAHAAGALLVVVVSEALSLALLESPGAAGADIVCGEAQSFGVPMGLGGPHLGFLACRARAVRQMPGRLVGETRDVHGQRGFVLTLSTREQHIRRERATSNICTNQGLCLLMATVYLSLLGRRGLRQLAEQNLAKAEYARSQVRATPGLELLFEAPSFNEFAVRVPGTGAAALERARQRGLVGGLDLAPHRPEPAVLVCTTESCRREEIDALVAALAGSRP
ncbi:MAG: aminomethyl-transferring glycine dehydrogenase subunit GcvPA [Proteobacteria bacterium]|nr:aminomethyl-transferring glycine dehydrogenase subunit GcvPA [Pseudomonadota bacterium]